MLFSLCAKPWLRSWSRSGQNHNGLCPALDSGLCSAAVTAPWAHRELWYLISLTSSLPWPRRHIGWLLCRCRPALKDPKANIDHIAMAVIAVGVSSAMAFLERKRVIHRDVAARNVLVRRCAACARTTSGLPSGVSSARGHWTKHNVFLAGGKKKWHGTKAVSVPPAEAVG